MSAAVRLIENEGAVIIVRFGEIRYANGDSYAGELAGSLRHGNGMLHRANGDAYTGSFVRDLFSGHGEMHRQPFIRGSARFVGQRYEGEWLHGRRNGHGKFIVGDGCVYDGGFVDDAFSGEGTLLYAVMTPSTAITGRDQLRDRQSILEDTHVATLPSHLGAGTGATSAAFYRGTWLHGKPHGMGTRAFPCGDVYSGGWDGGEQHGEGRLCFARGGGSYAGGWVRGMRCGIGRRVYSSGAAAEGEWRDGALEGRASLRAPNGALLYVGEWVMGKPCGRGTLSSSTGIYDGALLRGVPAGAGRWTPHGGKGNYEGDFNAQLRTGAVPLASAVGQRTVRRDRVATRLLRRVCGVATPHLQLHILPTKSTHLIVGSVADVAWLTAHDGGGAGTSMSLAADGLRHGRGRREWANGSVYEGSWSAGLPHGFGVYVAPRPIPSSAVGCAPATTRRRPTACDERFEGTWCNGQRVRGVASYGFPGIAGCATSAATAQRRFICPLGNAHPSHAARCIYDGEWRGIGVSAASFHGTGTFTCADGRGYTGQWHDGTPHGTGRVIRLPRALTAVAADSDTSSMACADALSSLMQGASRASGNARPRVSLDDAFRTVSYQGTFVNGEQTGAGAATLNCGDVISGAFVAGRPSGIVRRTYLRVQSALEAARKGARDTHGIKPELPRSVYELYPPSGHGRMIRRLTRDEAFALATRDDAEDAVRAAVASIGGASDGVLRLTDEGLPQSTAADARDEAAALQSRLRRRRLAVQLAEARVSARAAQRRNAGRHAADVRITGTIHPSTANRGLTAC